ncbi:hypothetical protein BJV82DRAFT_673162 [Fennellomyces sp. T-0311]|nr:hypothetical protein BJV82DRAFT_673162 [Fennellomyces sp. T-0311]
MRGYQQVSLGEEVVLVPLKPNFSAKKMVQPQDIKNFFAIKCSPTIRANKDSVYLTMIYKASVLGVESLHAKYSPIGSITEVDHFQRATVENNLATYMWQAYGIPMNNCEAPQQKRILVPPPEQMSTGLSAPFSTMSTTSTRMNASVTMERQPTMMSEDPSESIIGDGSAAGEHASSSSFSMLAHQPESSGNVNISNGEKHVLDSFVLPPPPLPLQPQPQQQLPQGPSFVAYMPNRPASRNFSSRVITLDDVLADECCH